MAAGKPLRDDDWCEVHLTAGAEVLNPAAEHTGSPGRYAVAAGHSRLRRRGLTLLVTAGAVIAWFAYSMSAPPLMDAPVRGVAIEILQPRPGASRPSAIRATYQVDGAAFTVLGVTGAFDGPVSVNRRFGSGRVRWFVVSAVPDCSDPATLDAARKAPHRLHVQRRVGDGRSSHGTPQLRGRVLDWDSAIQTACWQWLTAQRVHLVGLVDDQQQDRAGLRATLHSDLPRDIDVHVIDVADVATVDAPDSAVLHAGSSHSYRVRQPAGSCGSLQSLAWSLGPVGQDPQTVLTTALSAAQVSAIRAACARPAPSRRP